MIRYASLGSGSRGNAMLVECGRTRLLVDCGFGMKELGARLGRLGVGLDGVSAIILTHEHGDHSAGAYKCAVERGIRIHATRGTFAALGLPDEARKAFVLIAGDRVLEVGDLRVEPVAVPHDAREPVQFVFGDGSFRLGVLTDLGCVTPHVREAYGACDALVLECNHDIGMLDESDYPPSLKQRIRSRWGHLDNAAAASLLASVDTSRLRHVVAAHLSERNNHPTLAREALASALGCSPGWVDIADQESGFGWRELR